MKTLVFGIWIILVAVMPAQEKTKVESALPGSTQKQIIVQESDIWYVLQNRRSVRKFRADSIPEANIVKILDAARMAPTSGNQQPWKFLVIRDKDKINLMKEACIRKSMERYDKNEKKTGTNEQHEKQVRNVFEDYCSAPVYIIILTDNNSG